MPGRSDWIVSFSRCETLMAVRTATSVPAAFADVERAVRAAVDTGT